MNTAAPDWHARARHLVPDGRALIDGERRASASGETFVKTSPIDSRPLGEVARCSTPDIDAAVRTARAAFEDERWRGKSPAVRKRILQRHAELILAARDDLALLETLDMGGGGQLGRAQAEREEPVYGAAPGRAGAAGGRPAALAASTTIVGSYVGLSKLLVAIFPVFLLAWLRFGIAAVAMLHWLKRVPGEARLSPQDRQLLFWDALVGVWAAAGRCRLRGELS